MKSFDQVLDACIDRIVLHGETVEECLARHPEHAGALEQPLRVIYRVAKVSGRYTPTPAAKERGRQRLRRAVAELETSPPSPAPATVAAPMRTGGGFWFSARGLRVAGVFSMALLVFVGGPSLVAASGNALPGDALYPVKRGIEETRLVLQLSPTGKANLHLAFSERRANEMAHLMVSGEASLLEPIQKDLDQHLQEVAHIVDDLKDGEKATEVRQRLEDKSTKVLAGLEEALRDTPQEARTAARETFQATGRAFGETVDTVGAKAPKSEPAAAGSLLIVAIEPPDAAKLGVRSASIQVQRIEALRAGNGNQGWMTILEEPFTLELSRLSEASHLLAGRQVPTGTYSKIRFVANSATVNVNGVAYTARLSSEPITVVRPFQVKEGASTVLMLEFAGAKAISLAANGEYVLSPVVHVLDAAKAESSRHRNDPKAAATAAAGAAATNGRVEVSGALGQVTADSVVVRGGEITITAGTVVEGDPQTGQTVVVEGTLNAAGDIVASKVTVTEKEKEEKAKP